nr:hypothetical protein [uncultured Pseudomonas sp.]
MPDIEPSLPDDVLQALRHDDRAKAIDLLRQREGIASKQAQILIYQHLEANPRVRPRGAGIIRQSKLNGLIWLSLIALMAIAYLLLLG